MLERTGRQDTHISIRITSRHGNQSIQRPLPLPMECVNNDITTAKWTKTLPPPPLPILVLYTILSPFYSSPPLNPLSGHVSASLHCQASSTLPLPRSPFVSGHSFIVLGSTPLHQPLQHTDTHTQTDIHANKHTHKCHTKCFVRHGVLRRRPTLQRWCIEALRVRTHTRRYMGLLLQDPSLTATSISCRGLWICLVVYILYVMVLSNANCAFPH